MDKKSDNKERKMRFTEEELSLIKNTFAENEDMMKVIRKVFLQMPLDVFDQAILKDITSKPSLVKLIRKSFLPTLDPKAPIHQVIDLWMTLKLEGKSPEMVSIDAMAREKLIKYLDEQLKRLEGSTEIGGINFDDLHGASNKEVEDIYIDLVVRNTLISHTEMQINQFLILAGLKNETMDETMNRLAKDSSK